MNKKILIPLIVVVIIVVILVWLKVNSGRKGKLVGVITFVDHPVLNTIETTFREELRRLVGEDYSLEFLISNANGRIENLQSISRSMLRKTPYVIVSISTPVSQALMREADVNQRIVYSFVTNPSDLGDELTRTNSTGLSDAVNYAANLKLIRDVFGERVTIGMLYNPNETNSVHGVNSVESLINQMKLEAKLVKATVQKEAEIPAVTSRLATNADVIYVGGDNTVVGAMPAVINEALRKGVPVFASDEGSIRSGAVAGVSVDYRKLGLETAKVVKDVLEGKEPRDIPRITIRGDKLVINKAASVDCKLQLPDNVVDRADEVISN